MRTDNRLENLRFVTQQENNRNSSLNKNNTSGLKGVSFHKNRNKWCAHIAINGKKINLGYFMNIEDAKRMRQHTAKQIFGIYINSCEI
jgi:hypothetical protein